MLELEYESKIIKNLLVIKEICTWLQTFRPSNPGGSQEHISLITNSFLMILLSYSNSSIKGTEILGSVLYLFFYERPFLHVCNLVENLFSTLIIGSFFNDYVVFYMDISLIL